MVRNSGTIQPHLIHKVPVDTIDFIADLLPLLSQMLNTSGDRGCCWDSNANKINSPFCFLKQQACKGYSVSKVQESAHGLTLDLQLIGNPTDCARFGPDIPNLTAVIDFETESRVRVKILNKDAKRYEVPTDALPSTESTIRRVDKRGYTFKYTQSPFTFSVTRVSNGEVVFDSSVAGMDSLIYENEYLEISSVLPEDANIYGLGEVVSEFRRDTRGTRQTMWSRDAATPVDQNLYGTHPFHLEMRNGNAHGVFLRNSNGMDVIITPKKITYKVIGGVLDFTIFTGPTPVDVVNQYTEVIGRPHMPPAWSLGFHQSRYGYKNIDQVESVVRRYKQENLPLDGMWIDIDYMDKFKDFTFDEVRYPKARVQAFARELASNNQSMILIVDPGIPIEPGYEPYDSGMRDDVFIKTLDGSKPIEGRVWPGQTYFPDFFNTNATWAWWQRELRTTQEDLGDNVYPWIDMNEPANFCSGACTKDTPKTNEVESTDAKPVPTKYAINNAGRQAPLDEKTLAENAVHKNGLRLTDTHNLYGHMESRATHHALLAIKPDTKPFILTRSSFPGTGDNWSEWSHLYYSIPGILSFGLFGIPFTGADICGFNGNTNEELCLRWQQLGALYPFSRNHNGIDAPDQEPYVWPNSVLPVTRQALQIRYSLLDYYYTAFERAHRTGQPVWQPLFFKYSEDSQTLNIDRQFLLGDSILVTPVLSAGQDKVQAYFPGHGRWFDFTTQKSVMEADPKPSSKDRSHRYASLNAKANKDPIPMAISGGSVIPVHLTPQLTVAATRLQPLSLLVALDSEGLAVGETYIDDGSSVQPLYQAKLSFELKAGQLVSRAALRSPSGTGADLKGMTPAQAQEFREKLNHSDRIEKIVVMGLAFGQSVTTTTTFQEAKAQEEPLVIHRHQIKHERPSRFSSSSSKSLGASAKALALSELNINGAQLKMGDALQGQDPATGYAWQVNQEAGSLTLSGLKMDMFSEWFIHWKTA
ncbi:hypothetical protein BGZ65_006199 [Modicella reniformis]|uniref:Maltase n=1 Tax=Modicella reniformis TaxID=1440133 RepID=A0A9P6MB09_9FUNG|nr:hypothetical protein BGZ65_006199 [Modicella reniformis]